MLPTPTLILSENKEDFKYLENLPPYNPLIDYESGNTRLDTTADDRKVLWSLSYDDYKFRLFNGIDYSEILAEIPKEAPILVQKVALAFDQNMRPVWGYSYYSDLKINDNRYFSKIIWFDGTLNKYVEITIPGAKSLCMTLDDNRKEVTDSNDVIVAYVRNNILLMRYQRDRYAVDKTVLQLPEDSILSRIGMTSTFRFQFEIKTLDSHRIVNNAFLLKGM